MAKKTEHDPRWLEGKTYTIVRADPFRIILEEDHMGEPQGDIVVILARSIEGVSHGMFEIKST